MPQSFDEFLHTIRQCRICVESPTGAPLPHVPNPVLRATKNARIAICGQAPGTRVHKYGIPFLDPSGDRLRDWLALSPAEFYDDSRIAIVPMGFCFPGLTDKGADKPPRKECGPTWRSALFEHLDQLELILVIGQYAMRWHMGREAKQNLTETVRDWRNHLCGNARPLTVPLPHPSWRNNAWLRANPWFEKQMLPPLRDKLHAILGDAPNAN